MLECRMKEALLRTQHSYCQGFFGVRRVMTIMARQPKNVGVSGSIAGPNANVFTDTHLVITFEAILANTSTIVGSTQSFYCRRYFGYRKL